MAGINAKCYKVVGKSVSFTARYCYSSDGAPLFLSIVTSEGSTTMTATSYAKSVSASAFDLPAAASAAPSGSSPTGNDPCSYCGSLSGDDKAACMESCSR